MNAPSVRAFQQNSIGQAVWEMRWPCLFIAPCGLGLLSLTYGPTLFSVYLSFCHWDLLGSPRWVGLTNYTTLLASATFWQVVQNTLVFMLGTTVAEVLVGLLLAQLLNVGLKGLGWLRFGYFLPYVTPMVCVALVWGWFFDGEQGLLNQVLIGLGVIQEPVAWLMNKQTALPAIMTIEVWKMVGYNMLLFLAGLQAVPTELDEAGALDGAGPMERFFRITLPLITPTLFFVLLMTMIHTMQAFDQVYLLTQGGPENHTALVVFSIFQHAFMFYKVGPASAMAYLLFVVILGLTLIQWRLRKRWVLNEGDEESKPPSSSLQKPRILPAGAPAGEVLL